MKNNSTSKAATRDSDGKLHCGYCKSGSGYARAKDGTFKCRQCGEVSVVKGQKN